MGEVFSLTSFFGFWICRSFSGGFDSYLILRSHFFSKPRTPQGCDVAFYGLF